MNTMYVVVPRHQELQSLTPSGMDGMKFTTKYGFIGLSVEQKEFMVEGVNEKGLSAGLFISLIMENILLMIHPKRREV